MLNLHNNISGCMVVVALLEHAVQRPHACLVPPANCINKLMPQNLLASEFLLDANGSHHMDVSYSCLCLCLYHLRNLILSRLIFTYLPPNTLSCCCKQNWLATIIDHCHVARRLVVFVSLALDWSLILGLIQQKLWLEKKSIYISQVGTSLRTIIGTVLLNLCVCY
jgi:hypothetical protein